LAGRPTEQTLALDRQQIRTVMGSSLVSPPDYGIARWANRALSAVTSLVWMERCGVMPDLRLWAGWVSGANLVDRSGRFLRCRHR